MIVMTAASGRVQRLQCGTPGDHLVEHGGELALLVGAWRRHRAVHKVGGQPQRQRGVTVQVLVAG